MQNTHSTLQLKMCLFKSKMFALLLWVYNFKKMESWRKWVSECPVNVLLNSFLASGDLSSADNLCKQFGPSSGPTECQS